MPPYSSYLLQPFNVGCFSPLKHAYSCQIEALIYYRVNHIIKKDFLPAFKAAYDNAITEKNIISSFRGAGLVPINKNAVLSKLDVRIRTPTPPILDSPLWEP
jgi:hypothetical protein